MTDCENCSKLQEKIKRLEDENSYLRSLLHSNFNKKTNIYKNKKADHDSDKNASEYNREKIIRDRIQLFRSLFRGRTDVYARRWESKTGKSGYSPICGNEWNKPICQKPKIKCSQCPNKKPLPLNDEIIYAHLAGEKFIGIYPLLENETCFFLAIDFDKDSWERDILAFYRVCKNNAVPALLERSQSGRGGHIWIFFSNPISASIARNLGTSLLALTMQENPHISMDSYDRLFPSQDTIPKGGYGNLIALPLQGNRRKEGNSLFLDESLQPIHDPWKTISQVKKIGLDEVCRIINTIQDTNAILESDFSYQDDGEESKPWESLKKTIKYPIIDKSLFPKTLEIFLSNQLYIQINLLPSKLINELKRLAAFPNPEFFKAQKMRLSTYGKARIISCSEILNDYIRLPRGCQHKLEALLDHYKIKKILVDKTNHGNCIETNFIFKLNEIQEEAFNAMMKHNYGILSAVTGFGKTVLAGKIVSERKTNTLVLVHRQQLLEQWRDKLGTMLEINSKMIGTLSAGKNKLTKYIDIATLQSVISKGDVKSLVNDYGQLIVDECHHVSAFSFEQILKAANPKYVLGLTATPKRKDGHHPIITMQCGPIRYQISSKKQVEESPYRHHVIIKKTDYSSILLNSEPKISDIYKLLLQDEKRNQLICNDILLSLSEGRTPLLLTERTEHLSILNDKLKDHVDNIFVLKGGLREKTRKKIIDELFSIPENTSRLIIATGKYIGEGFDDPRLDTLFLALPISWQGTLQQYVGRLHRHHKNKDSIKVYDYLDDNISMLGRMFQKRLKQYKSMGYQVEVECE